MHSIRYALLFIFVCTSAFAGTVRTRDGKSFQGRITPAVANTLTITPDSGAPVSVEWANVRQAVFIESVSLVRIDPTRNYKHLDLGKVHLVGTAHEKEGRFSLTGSGWGAWGPKDSGQLLYWGFEGDGQIIAHVASYGDESIGAMAGVMFRSSLNADASSASSLIYPNGEYRFNRRPTDVFVWGPDNRPNPPKPGWVRLTRRGNTFGASHSKDGRFWQILSSQKIDMPAVVYAGLFVANGTNTQTSTAHFDQVQLIPGTPSATYFEGAIGPASGIVLVDGSMLAGYPKSLSDGKVSLIPTRTTDGRLIDWPRTDAERKAADQLGTVFPQSIVARLRFSTEPPDLLHIAPPGGAGVLLAGGDFIDGEISRLAYFNYLDIQSVVFGAKRFDVPREAICAILRETKPEKAAYEVRLREASVIQARSVELDQDAITLDSPLAGILKFPLSELVAIEAVAKD